MTDYKKALEAELAKLSEELSIIGIHNPDNPTDWIAVPEGVDANQADLDQVADIVEEWDERQALVATLERRWNDINRALEKINGGTFGICEIGGEPIETPRLNANPSARTCIQHMNEENILPT